MQDVLKGTQLLATDVTVAVSLLKSSMSGHNLTERERKVLRRTCTDLASVIPIGILMLLPLRSSLSFINEVWNFLSDYLHFQVDSRFDKLNVIYFSR